VESGACKAARAAITRTLVTASDVGADPDHCSACQNLVAEGLKASFSAPLVAKDRVYGVLEVFSRTPQAVDAEWTDYLETLAGQLAIAIDNRSLFDSLERSNAELARAYDTTLEGWSRALELRDRETQGHTARVTELTLAVAREMGIGGGDLVTIRRGVLLHDIGKMGIPDGILLKPGPLSPEEWVVMRRHPQLAHDLLHPIEFLRSALDIPYCHHEWWDGTGYPRGLKGEAIPLAARIFAVVDSWDGLCVARPYREAWPPERVRAHIRAEAGTHFDPSVVEVFLRLVG
jgi:putative nucleotidyltransferase with HDIG domain